LRQPTRDPSQKLSLTSQHDVADYHFRRSHQGSAKHNFHDKACSLRSDKNSSWCGPCTRPSPTLTSCGKDAACTANDRIVVIIAVGVFTVSQPSQQKQTIQVAPSLAAHCASVSRSLRHIRPPLALYEAAFCASLGRSLRQIAIYINSGRHVPSYTVKTSCVFHTTLSVVKFMYNRDD
jgi:hypothetical protein